MMSSTTLKVLSPRGIVKESEKITMPTGLQDLTGKRVGLFWNGKPGGDILMTRIAGRLQERFKNVKVIKYLPAKPDTSKGADPAVIKKTAAEVDVILNSNLD